MMRKNNLDEMQEQKLLKIERNGMWFAFWGLLAAILIQMCIGIEAPHQILGEWIVFMLLALYIGVACLRNGIWDRHLKPNAKTNFVSSLLAGIVVASVQAITIYNLKQKFYFMPSLFTGIFTCIICFSLLQFCSMLYKKRVKKLESE